MPASRALLNGWPLVAGQAGASTPVVVSALATISRSATIAFIGDSTVAGQSTGGGVQQAVKSFPSQFADMLAASGLKVSDDIRFGDRGSWGLAQNITNYLTGDNRVSVTGAWGLSSDKIAGGNNFGSAAAGSMTDAPRRNVRKWRIRFRDGAGRSFTAQAGASGVLTVNSTGGSGIVTTLVDAGSSGLHPLTLTWAAGNVPIWAIEGYDDASGVPMLIYNWGICGATSTMLVDNTTTPTSRLAQIGFYQPDLCVIEGGAVNDWRTSVPRATTKANLTTLVQAAKAAKTGAQVLLMTPVFDNGTAGLTAQQDDYVLAMKEVGLEQGVPVLDVRPTFQSWAYANAQGWMSDAVHPSAAGYAIIAGLVRNAVAVSA